MGAIALTQESRRLERRGPRDKRRHNDPLNGDRFTFDMARAQPIDHAYIRHDRKAQRLTLEIDFYSARDGWRVDHDPERWEDEKLSAHANPTRAAYREIYRIARSLLRGTPVVIDGAAYLPIGYYGRADRPAQETP